MNMEPREGFFQKDTGLLLGCKGQFRIGEVDSKMTQHFRRLEAAMQHVSMIDLWTQPLFHGNLHANLRFTPCQLSSK